MKTIGILLKGVCGEPQSLIDLIVYMDDEGLAPDQHILHALAKALTTARAMAEEEEVVRSLTLLT